MPDTKKAGAKKSGAKPAKRSSGKKTGTAKASQAAMRKTAAPKPAPPKPAAAPRPETPPVLVNAVKPEEKLTDSELVESAVDSIEQSLKAAVPAAVAVNRKLVDIAQANMNSGLELARDMVGAKSPMEAMRLGMAYWQEHMGVFEAQAQELRALSAELMKTANEPIRAHFRRA